MLISQISITDSLTFQINIDQIPNYINMLIVSKHFVL